MKTRIWHTFLIAMLLFSVGAVTAFGELVSGGDTSGGASATAAHGDEYDYDGDSGDNWYYTTEAGIFDYYYEVYAYAEVDVCEVDGWAAASAVAQASAGSISASASCSLSSTGDEYEEDDPNDIGGYDWFSAYSGVSASWDVVAVAQIEEGTWSDAQAHACAYAEAGMY